MKGRNSQNRKNRKRNKHHLIPKSRGGQKLTSNLLLIDMEKHCAWHKLWGNRTLDEVIELLLRVRLAKKHQNFTATF